MVSGVTGNPPVSGVEQGGVLGVAARVMRTAKTEQTLKEYERSVVTVRCKEHVNTSLIGWPAV